LLKVVFVCTGNRFRSPLAEALFRARVGDLPIDVSSVGTLELGPAPVLPEALEEGARLGVDLARHRARPVTDSDLADADLVVGFERMHVVTAVVDGRAPRERTFTLPELVGLLSDIEEHQAGDPIEQALEALQRAALARPDGRRADLPELADPIGRGDAVYRSTADQVDSLVRELVTRLFGASAPGGEAPETA
jgi:protein-tyrosine phosphatase